MQEERLRFDALYERHVGVSEGVGKSYAEAARVCLDRHHASPQAFHIFDRIGERRAVAEWTAPDRRTKNAWANANDATEAGAYGLALGAVELARGLVTVRRADTLTGSDYYLARAAAPPENLEAAIRLEVSGMDVGDESRMRDRLSQKVRQSSNGRSNLPAIALVVAFKALKMLLADVRRG